MGASQIITIIISGVAAVVAIISLVNNTKHSNTDDGIDKGMIMAQLSAIRDTLSEIKAEIHESREQRQEIRTTISAHEQKLKTLFEKNNEIEERIKKLAKLHKEDIL